ncbi:M56 family metallopeptidase [Belliella sp. DSM 107340]|uniref:M56 family metallopeptidase n=1 Tax=Belliella calami TaxID=2923436 RepID=A0ABS9URS8_9BACT|nr:M56 family metallopeptidase [Belliella calami]MCH7399316.1 M56 family metallopeptidase [Belliella calami]
MILYFIKVALLMTVLLIIYKVFLSKINTFKFNRFYLLLSLMLSLVAPLIVLPDFFPQFQNVSHQFERILEFDEKESLPNMTEKASDPSNTVLPVESDLNFIEKSESKNPLPFKKSTLIFVLYLTGITFFTFVFITKILGFSKLIRSYQQENQGNFKFVLLDEDTLPFIFLNYFFINKEIYQNNQLEKEILEHELTHIRQKHSLDILFVEILKIFLWFNPVVWFYKNVIQLNHEYLADQAVNEAFESRTDYQLLLISKITQKSESFALSSSVNYSITKKRLQMMAEKTHNSKSILLKGYAIACSFLALAAFSSSVQGFQVNPIATFSQSIEKYEEVISNALEKDDRYSLVLKNLDIVSLRDTYNSLSEEDKEKVSEFPFLEESTFPKLKELQENSDKIKVTFKFSKPPAKKTIREDVWENWKKGSDIKIEIDDELVEVSLEDYSKEDFALYQVVENKLNSNQDVAYILKFTTHDYYETKHIKVKKALQHIIAEYQNNDQLDVMYFMKDLNRKKNTGENLQEIILDGILTHEQKVYKEGPHYHKGVFIPASLTRNGEWKSINIFRD